MNTYYYTKEQLLKVLEAWRVSEPPPPKGKVLRVAFPPPATLNLATITIDAVKSTYGKTLYRVDMTSPGASSRI